jgi:hypothetical protein
MPRPLPLRAPQLLEAPGLRTLLRSDDFGEWDALVASIVWLGPPVAFQSRCR